MRTGETDWKVLVINVDDPIASEVNGKLKQNTLD